MKKLLLITFAIISFISFKPLVFAQDRVMNSDKGKVLISQNEYKAIFNFSNGITKEIPNLFVMNKIGVDDKGKGGQKVFRMYMKIGEICEITNNIYFKGCKFDNNTNTFTINLHEFSNNNKIEYIIKFLNDKIETQVIQRIDDTIITIANNARDTSLGLDSINEKEVLMITIDNQKYIPVRFFSEILYYDVTFNASEKNATINAYNIMQKDKTNCSIINKTDSYYLYNECENGKLYILPATKKVYISPSVQTDNKIVRGFSYSNESQIMNAVADYLVPQLESRGIVTFRNNPSMSLEQIVNESKSLNVDFHFAIHSNALPSSSAGQAKGPSIFIQDNSTKNANELAKKIYNSLLTIYPDPNKGKGILKNRLMETNPNRVNNGVLVEVAFHDNYDDAKWIIDNFQLIGETMANAIADYYGM